MFLIICQSHPCDSELTLDMPSGSSYFPASSISDTISGLFSFIYDFLFNFLPLCTISWLQLTIIIVPHHWCFWSVRVMLTGDMASWHHWFGMHILYSWYHKANWQDVKHYPINWFIWSQSISYLSTRTCRCKTLPNQSIHLNPINLLPLQQNM